MKYSVRALIERNQQALLLKKCAAEPVAGCDRMKLCNTYASEMINYESKDLGMCHVIVPAHVQLEKILSGYDAEYYRAKKIQNMDKELELVWLSDGTIRLDVYVRRSLYERLKQCGLFAIYEYKIRDSNHLATVLYSLIEASCVHELNIEYNNWDDVPEKWKYLSDDSSSECY